MLNVNARSLYSKLADFEALLLEHDPDAVVVTETWLSESILDSEVLPPGYRMVRRDRGSRGGGVALVLKEYLNISVLEGETHTESCWVKIESFSPPLVIGAVYRPPNSHVDVMESLYDFMGTLVKKYKLIILAGDFNLAYIDWEHGLVTRGGCESSERLIDMCFDFNLTQIVKTATRQGGNCESILDLGLVSSDIASREFSCDVVDGISDHKVVVFNFHCGLAEKELRSCNRLVYNFDKAADSSVLDELYFSLTQFEQLFSSPRNNVEEMWLFFKTLVFKCLTSFVPQRELKPKRNNPWITRHIIHLGRQLKRLRKKRPFPSTEYANAVASKSTNFKQTVRQARHTFYDTTLASYLKLDPAKFWRHLASGKETVVELTHTEGGLITEPFQIARHFNEYFSTVFCVDDGSFPLFDSTVSNSSLSNVSLSQVGIFSALLNLNKKKAIGPDNIPTEFIIRYAECCSQYIYLLFRKSLEQGIIPLEWKCAKITPVHKSGKKTEVSNYRPISLLCAVGKLLEHIVTKHICTFVEQSNILSRYQHGFRRGLSTLTQLVETTHFFAEVVNRRGQVDAIFLDFSKAFDRVSHSKLLLKLNRILGNKQILTWLSNYFQGRSQFVQVKESRSSSAPVLSGVPQGSVLGPLLFLLFINDLTSSSPLVSFRFFADDLVMFSEVKNIEDQKVMNRCLQSVLNWCMQWQMTLNPSKCVSMTITRKRNPLSFVYQLNDSPLEQVSSFKYLGVQISADLRWNRHVDYIYGKAMSKLWYLRRSLKHATSSTKLAAYKTLVRPTLEYADVIWDPYTSRNISKLEEIQKKALRFIYNKYRKKSSVGVLYNQAGVTQLSRRRKINRLKFLYNTLNGAFNIDHETYISLQAPHATRSSHSLKLVEYQCRNDVFKYSFFPRTIREWNHLPPNIVNSPSVSTFTSQLDLLPFTEK